MIAILVSTKADPDHIARSLRDSGLDALHFWPEALGFKTFKNSTSAFWAFSSATTEGRVIEHQNGAITLVDGSPEDLTGVLMELSTGDFTRVRKLGGDFSLVHVLPDGTAYLFSDATGLRPLYYADCLSGCFASNRFMMLEALVGPKDDLLTLSWLVGQSSVFGESTPNPSIRRVRGGDGIRLTSQSAPRWFPGGHWGTPEKIEPTPQQFDELTHDLVTHVKSMCTQAGEVRLGLTGGYDSRLILSLVIGANCQDRLSHIFTSGRPGSPEIECAAAICGALDLPHTARYQRPGDMSAQTVWDRLHQHAFRFESMVCPWDGLTGQAKKSSVQLSGIGGEIASGHVKAHRNLSLSSADTARRVFRNYQQPTDPLGLLKEEFVRSQYSWFDARLQRHLENGGDINDFSDVLFLENRLPTWSGILAAGVLAADRKYPFVHPSLFRILSEAHHTERHAGRFHYEIMRRAAPALVELPFLGKTWDRRLWERASRDGLSIAKEPYRSTRAVTSENLVAWQWFFLDNEWDTIFASLLDEQNSPVFDVLQRSRLEMLREQGLPAKSPVAAKAVFSALAMNIRLLRKWKPVRDGERKPVRLVGEAQRWFRGELAPASSPPPSTSRSKSAPPKPRVWFFQWMSPGMLTELHIKGNTGSAAVLSPVLQRRGWASPSIVSPPDGWSAWSVRGLRLLRLSHQSDPSVIEVQIPAGRTVWIIATVGVIDPPSIHISDSRGRVTRIEPDHVSANATGGWMSLAKQLISGTLPEET